MTDYVEIIQAFVDEVNRRAEKKMLSPPYKLEGMHYASMTELMDEINSSRSVNAILKELEG